MRPSVEIPFEYDFGTKAPPAVELEDGDLLISGWALRFDEESDREGDRWIENPRLIESMRRFVEGGGNLLHNHQWGTVLGRTLAMEPVPGKGIKVRAQIFKQEPHSPLRHLYDAARKGALGFFSIGGRFDRQGTDLIDADVMELSICGTGVGRKTAWRVIEAAARNAPAGKAVTTTGGYRDMTYGEKSIYQREKEAQALKNARAERAAHEAAASTAVRDEIFEVPVSALIGEAPRRRDGSVDEAKMQNGYTLADFADEQGMSYVGPEDHARLYGIDPVPVVDPGPTPEAVFRRQAEDSRLDKIRSAFRKLEGGS